MAVIAPEPKHETMAVALSPEIASALASTMRFDTCVNVEWG